MLRKSQNSIFLRRAMYSQQTYDTNLSPTSNVENATEKAAREENELKLDELDEEEFEGKVTVENWAMSRAQKIIRNLSFDSDTYDIYAPKFSSEGADSAHHDFDIEAEEHLFETEEAKGKICDERLSEMNPCGDGDSLDSDSSASEPNIRPDLLSQALSAAGHNPSQLSSGAQSNNTEMERCPPIHHDSENLHEDDIRESLAVK